MPVRQLPDTLINRIAAGEVVERPASVVKELVENALDAGATRISVTATGGGIDLIRVEDDGSGMDKADLALAVERHATSKLWDDNLDDIRTLGFRGEALASIGSVSDLSIATRRRDDEAGLKIEVRRGAKLPIRPHGMNPGTIVEVRDLFAALPARRKFLRSERAEAAAISDVVKRLAMANPSVHFVLEGADRPQYNWPSVGEGGLGRRVAQILGPEFSENAAVLAHTRHGVVVAGLAGLPTYSRANSLSQFFFVNGRTVRDKVLLGAVRAAYADFTFRDRFPVIALFVAIAPEAVDVNVHPAKAELRFRDPGSVRSAVVRAIGEALDAAGFRASTSLGSEVLEAFRAPAARTTDLVETESSLGHLSTHFERPAPAGAPRASFSQPEAFAGFAEPTARFEPLPETGTEPYPLGVARAQLFENFIVAQNGDSLVLVDQHAAHERLMYEKFKAELAQGIVARQALLIPVVVELDEGDCARLVEAGPVLEELGLVLERFGERAVAVREVPALLGRTDAEEMVRDLADQMAEWEGTEGLRERLDAVIGRMACHGSVRSGRRLRAEEMNALLRAMEQTPHSGQCIHGRPTYVELKKRDIERLFGRTR